MAPKLRIAGEDTGLHREQLAAVEADDKPSDEFAAAYEMEGDSLKREPFMEFLTKAVGLSW